MPIKLLAQLLSQDAELPVVDQTGLTGYYEVAIAIPGRRFSRGSQSTGAMSSKGEATPEGVDLSQSVAAIGLKLEKGRSSLRRLVVDHANIIPTKN